MIIGYNCPYIKTYSLYKTSISSITQRLLMNISGQHFFKDTIIKTTRHLYLRLVQQAFRHIGQISVNTTYLLEIHCLSKKKV